jgi:SAM-dependent methyltransferase
LGLTLELRNKILKKSTVLDILKKTTMSYDQRCVVSCDKPLDKEYWDAQYKAETTAWDLGQISPPIKTYIDTLKDKNTRILIPGCGNTYEAEYLLKNGFNNVTVIDIAPTLVGTIKQRFSHNPNIKIILGDFFEHYGSYDLILEQTFFCALPPSTRQKYVWKIHQLLSNQGILAGLLFNRVFEVSPPFGGSKEEYETLFEYAFDFLKMDVAQNSITPRANNELFIEFKKNKLVTVLLYKFEGITCISSASTVIKKIEVLNDVLNASISTNFTEVLIVSKKENLAEELQKIESENEKYSIVKI